MVDLFRSTRISSQPGKSKNEDNISFLSKGRSQSSVADIRITNTKSELTPFYNDNQRAVIRASLLIVRAYKEDISKIARECVSSLMLNDKYYTNTLVDSYLNEINNDANNFYNRYRIEIIKLQQINKLLTKDNLDSLDKIYLLNKEYLPLREDLENHFCAECETFGSKYGININKFYDKYSHLIWQGRQNLITTDVYKLFRIRLFRSLAINYKDQLQTLAPYNLNFTSSKEVLSVKDNDEPFEKVKKSGKHRTGAKKLEKILSGLSDYECFRYQYDCGTVAGGNRSYLSSFANSIETITKIVIDRDKAKTDINSRRLQCANQLWQLFANLVAVDKFCKEFATLTEVAPKSTVEVIDIKNVEMDPGIYFNYVNDNIYKLIKDNNCKTLTTLSDSDIARYLALANNYQICCQQIFELIETIIPLLNIIIDFNNINSDRAASGSNSSRTKRKITMDQLQPLSITTTVLYDKFLLIKNSYVGQSRVLEQILENLVKF